MSGRRPGLPRLVARALGHLHPGATGAEILEELEREYRLVRDRRGRWVAGLWSMAQLLRPHTWLLAAELRNSSTTRSSQRTSILTRRRPYLGASWLDVKLGVRMLAKHPGMTLVIVLALGVGIPASLLPHLLLDAALYAPLPLDGGDRIRAVVMWNPQTGTHERPRIDHYEAWREQLTTVETLGAARSSTFNLIDADGHSAPARGAAVTASSFTLTGVPPLLGRTLFAADERPDAPDVAVVGHDLWRARYGSDSDVIGSTVRIAGTPTTVVGVMPAGYTFPRSEQIWVALRARALDYAPGTGPSLSVYGRLAQGASDRSATAEIETVRVRTRTPPTPDAPEEAVERRPQVVHFSAVAFGTPRGLARIVLAVVQALPLFLLLIVCGNVAVLLLARTANRTGELAVRTALGAGRSRILAQLFVETLVPAVLATALGMGALHLALVRLDPLVQGPFWLQLGVTVEASIKALVIAAFCAVVAGVLPALKATGRQLHGTLQSNTGATGGLRFGRLVDVLIVIEVALGVGALFAGIMAYRMFTPAANMQLQAIEADRFLVASITVPPTGVGGDPSAADRASYRERIAADHRELQRLLQAEPGVRAATIADAPPGGENKERRSRFTDDGLEPAYGGSPAVVSYIDLEFFRTLDVSPVRGRLFEASDVPLAAGVLPTSIIVNSKFVERTMHERDPVGRLLRLELEPGPVQPESPVFEIVGVVPDLENNAVNHMFDGTPVAYLPAAPGTAHPFSVIVDVGPDPAAFAPRLRRIVAEADPTALVSGIGALDEPSGVELVGIWALTLLASLAGIAIALSTAALYALMSFTIARRTREIGIRTALGGSKARIVWTVSRRALLQLGTGVGLGAVFWVTVLRLATGGWGFGAAASELAVATAQWPTVLLLTAGAVVSVGLAACMTPTLKGIRIRPVDALRTE